MNKSMNLFWHGGQLGLGSRSRRRQSSFRLQVSVDISAVDCVSVTLLSQIKEILPAERQQPPDQQRHGRRLGQLHLRRSEQTPEHLGVLRAVGAR